MITDFQFLDAQSVIKPFPTSLTLQVCSAILLNVAWLKIIVKVQYLNPMGDGGFLVRYLFAPMKDFFLFVLSLQANAINKVSFNRDLYITLEAPSAHYTV